MSGTVASVLTDDAAADLVAVLLGPDLPGARCRGRWPAFDEWLPGESPATREPRVATAIALCADCPVRQRCRELRDALPGRQAGGIWGGRLWVTSPRPPVLRRPT